MFVLPTNSQCAIIINKESVEPIIYLFRGSGMPMPQINIPHTRIVEYGAEHPKDHTIRSDECDVHLVALKFSRFRNKVSNTLSSKKYVVPREQLPRHHKISKSFAIGNTLPGSCLARIQKNRPSKEGRFAKNRYVIYCKKYVTSEV